MKMTWDIDRREQQLSPTLAIGIKPGVQWLEFFGNYGKSWRPPAITEVLATGSAHGHGWILPNPVLAAEYSKAWEAGMNIQHSHLFIAEDRLARPFLNKKYLHQSFWYNLNWYKIIPYHNLIDIPGHENE